MSIIYVIESIDIDGTSAVINQDTFSFTIENWWLKSSKIVKLLASKFSCFLSSSLSSKSLQD